MRVNCFDPIIDQDCTLLVLGTAPGGQSLLRQEYYAHGGNRFWTIMQHILNAKGLLDYAAKRELLLKNRIALWDVIKECDRKTSKDSDIENEVVNDFTTLLNNYPNIQTIVFNGHKPKMYFDIYVKLNKPVDLKVVKSTSPSNNRNYSLEELIAIWKPIIKNNVQEN